MKKIIIKSVCIFLVPLSAMAQDVNSIQKVIAHEQKFVANNNDTIIATISQKEITRIAFDSEIAFISSIAGELEYTAKEQDLYLKPNVEKPINFFVKTADEQTYKFLVDASDIPATQIFIQSKFQSQLASKLIFTDEYNHWLQKRISKLIDVALKPRKYLGFKFKKADSYLGAINDVNMQKIAEIFGQQLSAEIITITNEGNKPKTIDLMEFMDDGIMALYADKSILKVNEKAKLIRIKGNI